MSDFSPVYGRTATGVITPVAVDINGNLFFTPTGSNPPINVFIAGPAYATADGVSGGNVFETGMAAFNGATVDRWNTNLNLGALITATGVTTTQNSADQTSINGRGVIVTLNMTTVGTGSVTVHIQGKDTVSGLYFDVLISAAITTNSLNPLTVYPGVTPVVNTHVSDVLPRTWRISVVANNANATTYTVGASVIV